MTSEPTPGPWQVAEGDDDTWDVLAGDTLVATVYEKADAACIAAVPDMCASLAKVCGGPHRMVGITVKDSIHQLGVVKEAAAAMKKATAM